MTELDTDAVPATDPSPQALSSAEHDDYGKLLSHGFGAVAGFVEQALAAETHSDYLRACLPQIARRFAASIVVVRYDRAEDDVHVAERWHRSDRSARNWAPTIDALGWEAENEGRPVGRILHQDEMAETVGIACPLFAPGGAVAGSLSILTETFGDPSPQLLLAQLIGTGGLVNAGLRQPTDKPIRAVPDATSALARAGRHPDLRSYGSVLCSGLRDRVGCEQVLFGEVRTGRVDLLAVSGIDEVHPRGTAVSKIQQAMGECLDLGEPVLSQPESEDAAPSTASALHRAWSERADHGCVLSLPLIGDGKTVAVVSFVRAKRAPFRENEIEQLRAATAAVGPAVSLLQIARRPLKAHLKDSLTRRFSSLMAKGAWRRRLTVAAVSIFMGWFLFADMQQTVVVPATVRPTDVLHLTAPYEARLIEQTAQAGDIVAAGQTVCRFDTTDLQLQLAERLADSETAAIEAQQALAIGDVQTANLAEARRAVALAQAATLEQRIDSAVVVAPFRGRILRGDLETRVGQTLPQGEPLFELSPVEQSAKLRLDVPEEYALDLAQGASVRFLSNARPEDLREFEIGRIAPAAEVVEARNIIAVEARVRNSEQGEGLRAGMEGLCEVSLGDKPVWRVALDPLIRWSHQSMWW